MKQNKKEKKENHALIDFLHYIGKYRIAIIISAVMALSGAILNLIGPSKLADVTNLITSGLKGSMNLTRISQICFFLAFLYGLGFLLNYAQGFIMATISQRITQNMRTGITEKINRLPLAYFDSHLIGDTLSRITNDVDTIGQMMNQSLSTLVSSLALLLGSVVMMFSTNAIMAIAGIIATLVGIVFLGIIIGRSQGYFSKQQEVLGEIDGHVEEIYSGHVIVKAYNDEDNARQTFHSLNDRLYDCAYKSQFLSGLMMPLMIFIGNLSYVAVCVTGALLAMNGTISFGIIVSFMLYIRLFTQPLQNLSQAATSLQSMTAACERVFAFLGEEKMTEDQGEQVIKEAKGSIDFEHVSFGYVKNQIIIKDFTTQVHPGEKIAIVGPTGAGKTTLVNLLMRFYEINGGSISIDHIDTKTMTKENVHDLFGMVLQDTWLFEGTLRENLVYNCKNISDDRLDQVCQAVGLEDLVEQLEDGYDTLLDENVALSAGQKQLLTIARAMAKDAPFLILDEATSSVDTRTEIKVQKAMDQLMEGRTSFVIAHRLSTIKNADSILVLKDGDIIENGNHETLMKKNNFYADLYNSQFARV